MIATIIVAGLVGLAAAALLNERSRAFTLGVARQTFVEVGPRQEACQAPITVPEGAAFEGVRFAVGTNRRPGSRLDVSVRSGGRPLARGTLRGGYPDIDRVPEHIVWFSRVPSGRTVAVCLRNEGSRPVFIFANGDAATRSSRATIDGSPVGLDLALDFQRREPRSLAALVPTVLDRATLFRPGWVGLGSYVVMALLVVLAVPALLMRALRSAELDRG